jgi:hypothetical protein
MASPVPDHKWVYRLIAASVLARLLQVAQTDPPPPPFPIRPPDGSHTVNPTPDLPGGSA